MITMEGLHMVQAGSFDNFDAYIFRMLAQPSVERLALYINARILTTTDRTGLISDSLSTRNHSSFAVWFHVNLSTFTLK